MNDDPGDNHKYYITYDITPLKEGITKDQVPKSLGAADALILISILNEEDNSLGVSIADIDGKTGGKVPAESMFHSWVMMAHHLSERPELADVLRALCGEAFEAARELVLAARAVKDAAALADTAPQTVDPKKSN